MSETDTDAIASARDGLEKLNAVVRFLNTEYIGGAECDGEMAWTCVSCRAVNLRTQLVSFAFELADLYDLPDTLVEYTKSAETHDASTP